MAKKKRGKKSGKSGKGSGKSGPKHPLKSKIRKEVRQELEREEEIRKAKAKLCLAEKLLHVLVFLALIGVLFSAYLTWLYYSPFGGSLCRECKAVASSHYFSAGIPISFFAMVGYLAFIGLCFLMLRGDRFGPKDIHMLMIVLASIGLGFAVYMFIVQSVLLGAWCIPCVLSSLVIIAIFVILLLSYSYCSRCRKRLEKLGAQPGSVCRNY